MQVALSIIFRLHAEEKNFKIKDATLELVTLAESLFLTLWNGASDVERVLLTLAALRDYEELMTPQGYLLKDYKLIFSQFERELRELEERSIIIRHPNPDFYQYALFSPLMAWWIIKEIEARSDDEIVQQTEMFSNFLNSTRTTQILNLLLDVQAKKMAYKTLSAWVS